MSPLLAEKQRTDRATVAVFDLSTSTIRPRTCSTGTDHRRLEARRLLGLAWATVPHRVRALQELLMDKLADRLYMLLQAAAVGLTRWYCGDPFDVDPDG